MPRSRASPPLRFPARATMRLTAPLSDLFQLVAGGELDDGQVIERLIDACHRNRLIKDDGLRTVTATIQSARAGLKFPRSRPAAILPAKDPPGVSGKKGPGGGSNSARWRDDQPQVFLLIGLALAACEHVPPRRFQLFEGFVAANGLTFAETFHA